MDLLGALGSGGMGMADMAWNIKCREEDMEFRRTEIQWHMEEVWWRGVNDRKREVEEKAKQLEQVASLSALIAGFALVAMVEVSIPADVNPILLICFGSTAASVVGLMLLAMLSSTFMLVAIMKYDVKAKDPHYPSFQRFWTSRCESDWRFSFKAFNIGIPLFMGVLAEVGWITFDDGSVLHQVAAAAVTVIALVSGLFFYAYTYRKWGPFLSNLKLDLNIIQQDSTRLAPSGTIPATDSMPQTSAVGPTRSGQVFTRSRSVTVNRGQGISVPSSVDRAAEGRSQRGASSTAGSTPPARLAHGASLRVTAPPQTQVTGAAHAGRTDGLG